MMKIMVVDDSLMIRINLKRVFEKHGYEVVAEAANGQEAIDKFMKFHPDLVTMDITMPVLDGISALDKIHRMDSRVAVIMISALGQEMKIIEALKKGARHYIVKPFKEQDVIRIVESVMNKDTEELLDVCASR